MQNREVFRPWIVVLSLMTILGIFAARCLQTARAYSITADEGFHVSSSLHFWMTGDDLGLWRAGAPRLPHLINTSVPYLVLRQAGLLPAPSPELSQCLSRLVTDDKQHGDPAGSPNGDRLGDPGSARDVLGSGEVVRGRPRPGGCRAALDGSRDACSRLYRRV